MKYQNKCLFAFTVLMTAGGIQLKAQTPAAVNPPAKSVPIVNAIQLIGVLSPVSDTGNAPVHFGITTASVNQNIPAIMRTEYVWVNKGKNNQQAVATQKVDMLQLVPLLVAAIKEQEAEITALKKQIETLKAKTGN